MCIQWNESYNLKRIMNQIGLFYILLLFCRKYKRSDNFKYSFNPNIYIWNSVKPLKLLSQFDFSAQNFPIQYYSRTKTQTSHEIITKYDMT
jgi:hypothetical protein